ncbi:MAG TPA: OmpH family outer membrane protein, partial [Alphaproteobacteria bacterium]|nr:OmpH family outer membrane protein [Alphaproteobacteria bacterium]
MFSNTKIRNFILSLALASLLSLVAFAQAPGAANNASANTAAAVSTKIGIVYIQDAIGATNEGLKEADALQKRFGSRNNDLRAQNDELENLKKQLQAQADKLNDEERTRRAKEIDTKQKSFQRNAEDFQAEVQSAEQEIINRLGQKMLTVLDKYAKANGYAVVLDVS